MLKIFNKPIPIFDAIIIQFKEETRMLKPKSKEAHSNSNNLVFSKIYASFRDNEIKRDLFFFI